MKPTDANVSPNRLLDDDGLKFKKRKKEKLKRKREWMEKNIISYSQILNK
jgi:hypothetical protein